jgi:hypothetical protein
MPIGGWTAARVQTSEPTGDVNRTQEAEGSAIVQPAIAQAVPSAGSSASTGELNTRFHRNPLSWLS